MDNRRIKYPFVILFSIIFIYVFSLSIISFLKYKYFIYNDFDLAVHSQTLYGIIHGSTFSSILGKSFLGNHAHFILFLLAPIFFIFRSPLTLLFIQTLSLGLSAFALFKIARFLLDEHWGLLFSFLYLIYPALAYSNLFEFHPPALAVPMLFYMVYYFLKAQFKPMVIFMVFSLLCQENIALIVFMFGILALLYKRSPRWYIVPLVSSCLWFIFCIFIVMPFFAREKMLYFEFFYPHLGSNLSEALIFILSHPFQVIRLMLTWPKLLFVFQLFAPLAFVSLVGLELLLPLLPILTQHLISARVTEHNIYYHYTLEMIPFIFVSAALGIKRLKVFNLFLKRQALFKIIIYSLALLFCLKIGPFLHLIKEVNRYKDYQYIQKQRLLNSIPKDTPVVSTFEFLPKLSLRKRLYSFHNVLLSKYSYSHRSFKLPDDTRYALIDFNDKNVFYYFFRKGNEERIQEFLQTGDWGIRSIEDTVVLFDKEIKNEKYLYKILENHEAVDSQVGVIIDDAIKLQGFNVLSTKKREKIAFEFLWKALKDVEQDIAMYFDFVDGQGRTIRRIFRPICYRIMPTYSWKESTCIKEYRNLILPLDLEKGRYTIKLGFYYYRTFIGIKVKSNLQKIDKSGRIELIQIDL